MKKLWLWFDWIFESMVVTRLKADCKENINDLLQVLLNLNYQGDDENPYLSMDEIKAPLTDAVVAAPNTVTATVERTLTEMLQQQEKMRRSREQIEVVVGKHNVLEEFHLPKLLYLDAFIKETLRFNPPVPFLVPRDVTFPVAGSAEARESCSTCGRFRGT
ncbi:hypothetical protein SLE2022_022950 [Rubroshorea leprosula]